jgi:hypothetical protein
MQSTGGSLTSLIESRRCELVKAKSIEHCRSTEHVPTEQFYGLGAFQPVKSCRCRANFSVLIAFFSAGFRASRRLIQAML